MVYYENYPMMCFANELNTVQISDFVSVIKHITDVYVIYTNYVI